MLFAHTDLDINFGVQTPESGLFTEGSFVLVDGDYTSESVFKVNEMGHPPSERRSAARCVSLNGFAVGDDSNADRQRLLPGKFSDTTTFSVLGQCRSLKRSVMFQRD